MKAPDELVASFIRSMPTRIAEGTELWLSYEQGDASGLVTLRRLLHTIKGEAHMLDQLACAELAELAESLVAGLGNTREPGAQAGDAMLGAFEGMGLATVARADDEAPDMSGVLAQLRQACDELGVTPKQPAPEAKASPPAQVAEQAPSAESNGGRAEAGLSPTEVRPMVHELRRLHGEQTILQERFREMQRMLRALLAEIDPRLTPELLSERITKTLGYGTEVERRITAIRAEWSRNDFAFGLALDELDSTVRRASVVTTDRLLNHVRRVGRTTARMVDKDVDVQVSGDAILDSMIEQRLEAALLHLVRNAIDHGIESREERRGAGKSERGVVRVSVRQTESSVTVEVSDDGRGVHYKRLREVLRGDGLDVDRLKDEELLVYLFEQGITTRAQVTQLSGRGVGLDVVARELGAAGGGVRVESQPGQGTRFVLQLPAALKGDLVVPLICDDHHYAVPSRSVVCVARIGQVERAQDATMVRVDLNSGSELVRVVSLSSLLGGERPPTAGDAALVLSTTAGLLAMTVDSYDNPRPITVQRTEELPFESKLVRGAAATADGGVMLFLDVEALHASARGRAATVRQARDAATSLKRALVVEDAPVARELLCGILRSLGLRVDEATDGRQGLMHAQTEPPDIILTDLEMPYMDGIQMISELRRSERLSSIPVIVLTTAGTQENQLRLAELGVAAVLSKQRFVEAELRQLIDRCLSRTR